MIIKPSNAPRAPWDSPVEEEINDRLAFLAEELLGTSGSSTQAESCAAQITKKIKARKPTDAINPGNTYETDVSTAAPWEHSCLNHHSLLKLSLGSTSELEKENCKRACFEFLNSDYSFLPQWDGSNFMADKRFDVGSVICATLLDLRSITPLLLSLSYLISGGGVLTVLQSSPRRKISPNPNRTKIRNLQQPLNPSLHRTLTLWSKSRIKRHLARNQAESLLRKMI